MTDVQNSLIPAIVLAGAPAEPEMEAKFGVKSRAEAPIAGKAMVQYVIDALKGSPHVGNICVIGDITCEGADQVLLPAGTLLDNLVKGMEACRSDGDGCVLVATSDIPMVTAEAVEDFIGRCGDLSADFYYPIVPKEANEEKFPGMRRTYVKLAEGTFTGGNIMVMNSRFVAENADVIREVVAARKQPMKLARLIGIGTLLRTVIAQTIWAGATNLNCLEKTVGRILHADLKAVQTPYAEIGADVDDLEQLLAVERLVTGDRLQVTGD